MTRVRGDLGGIVDVASNASVTSLGVDVAANTVTADAAQVVADAAQVAADAAQVAADAALAAGTVNAGQLAVIAADLAEESFPKVFAAFNGPQTIGAGATSTINLSGGFAINPDGSTGFGFGGGTYTNPSGTRTVRALVKAYASISSALGASYQLALGGTHGNVSPAFNPTGVLVSGALTGAQLVEVITLAPGETVFLEATETGATNPFDVNHAYITIEPMEGV